MRLIAIGFLAGILLVQQLPALPSPWWGLLAVPMAVLWRRWPRVAAASLAILVGVMWVTLRAGFILDDHLNPQLEGADIVVTGVVADIPRPGEPGQRFPFDVLHAKQDGAAVRVPKRLQLALYDPDYRPQAGEAWRFSVRLKRPHGFQNPGGYDYEARLFQERIRATGYVRMEEEPALLDAAPAGYALQRLRARLSSSIARAVDGHASAGMIVAFANGDETLIGDPQWEVLARTGTTHLIAISGMNIGLVAGIAFLLMRRLWALPGRTVLWLPAQQAGALAALLAGTGYAALAGFAIPTQRALVMLAMVLIGVLARRPIVISEILAAALLAVLVFDPLSVMDRGFWLSFLAVAILVYVGRDLAGARGWRARAAQFPRLQWAVTIGLFPALLLMTQQSSLVAPFANLAAIPVIETLVIPATLLGAATSAAGLDELAGVILRLAASVMDALWRMLEWFAGLSWSVVSLPSPPAWTYAAAAVGIVWLLAPRGFPARYIGALWLLPLLFVSAPALHAGEWRFTLLDVGQGLASVVRTANHVLVYDTGARVSARFDTGRMVVGPYLRSLGITRIDRLIVSHGDNDHAGGAAYLRSAFPVVSVWSSDPDAVPGAELCTAPVRGEWDGVTFELLHPNAAMPEGLSKNDRSCVLRVSGPGGSVLLPGDIEADAEAWLLESGVPLHADILVAAHHGSKTSSTDEFIAAVAPRAVLFAAGYRSRFGHPHPDVVARYRKHGVRRFDSASDGAVEFRFDAAGWSVSRLRRDRGHYWQRETCAPVC